MTKCMHCVKKATICDKYGRYLCDFHDHEANGNKLFEAIAVIGSISVALALITIIAITKGVMH